MPFYVRRIWTLRQFMANWPSRAKDPSYVLVHEKKLQTVYLVGPGELEEWFPHNPCLATWCATSIPRWTDCGRRLDSSFRTLTLCQVSYHNMKAGVLPSTNNYLEAPIGRSLLYPIISSINRSSPLYSGQVQLCRRLLTHSNIKYRTIELSIAINPTKNI